MNKSETERNNLPVTKAVARIIGICTIIFAGYLGTPAEIAQANSLAPCPDGAEPFGNSTGHLQCPPVRPSWVLPSGRCEPIHVFNPNTQRYEIKYICEHPPGRLQQQP